MDVFEKCAEIIKAQKEIYYNAYEDGKASAGGGDGYDEGFEAGKQAEHDAFWDDFQMNGNRNDYRYAFSYTQGWTDETYNPKYPIVSVGVNTCRYMFTNNTNITDTKVDISILVNPTNRNFNGDATGVFLGCSKLKTIRNLIVDETTDFTSTFNNCAALENIKITGVIGKKGFDTQWSVKMSKESITSVINALSTTTTGLSITLSLTAVNNAFEGGSTGTEWTTLAGTRSNWTINLV